MRCDLSDFEISDARAIVRYESCLSRIASCPTAGGRPQAATSSPAMSKSQNQVPWLQAASFFRSAGTYAVRSMRWHLVDELNGSERGSSAACHRGSKLAAIVQMYKSAALLLTKGGQLQLSASYVARTNQSKRARTMGIVAVETRHRCCSVAIDSFCWYFNASDFEQESFRPLRRSRKFIV